MLAFKNALLIDGTGREPQKNVNLIIDNKKIVAVGTNIKIPESAVVIDLEGLTILPGFIEAHLHMGGITKIANLRSTSFGGSFLTNNYEDLRMSTLKCGVTTVRSCGDYLDDAVKLRNAIENDEFVGPRIITCGRSFQQKGGHPGSTVWRNDPKILHAAAALPDTAEEAIAIVRELAKAGVDFIKIIINNINLVTLKESVPKISFDIVKAITDEAHKYGLLVAAHCENIQDALKAVNLGVDNIEHLIIPYPEQIEINEEVLNDLFSLMVEKGTYLTPTAVVSKIHGNNDSHMTNYIFKKAFDAGVKITMGTDSGAPGVHHGEALHFELDIMVNQIGIPPLDIIKAVTKTNSELIGKSNIIGTIEKGKLADLLIISGNPTEDISTTKNVKMVIKNGEIIIDNFPKKY